MLIVKTCLTISHTMHFKSCKILWHVACFTIVMPILCILFVAEIPSDGWIIKHRIHPTDHEELWGKGIGHTFRLPNTLFGNPILHPKPSWKRSCKLRTSDKDLRADWPFSFLHPGYQAGPASQVVGWQTAS